MTRSQTPIKSSKYLFTEDILDNAQDTDAWAESFDTTIGYENDGVTQIDEAIEDTCTTATLMELLPVVSNFFLKRLALLILKEWVVFMQMLAEGKFPTDNLPQIMSRCS